MQEYNSRVASGRLRDDEHQRGQEPPKLLQKAYLTGLQELSRVSNTSMMNYGTIMRRP